MGRSARFKRGKSEEVLESAGMMRWLLTYADMITLLLALFIILFSISTVNKVKLQRLVHDLGGGFNAADAINNPPNAGTTGSQSGNDADALARIQRQINAYIKKNALTSKVQTHIDHRGLVISILTDKALYDSGSAELRPETKSLLDRIEGTLKTARNDIRVEGNTDNVPIATSVYPTNWELSAARATNVVRYLVEHDGLNPTRVSLAGYGEFHPANANDNDGHRQLNRRVDIVILNARTSADEEA